MQVQVFTNHTIHGSAHLAGIVEAAVEASLGRFGEQLTRVEVHLSDINGAKHQGDDKQCVMEARPAGRQPVAVTHVASTIDRAVDGAAERMVRVLTETFQRLHKHKGGTSLSEDATG